MLQKIWSLQRKAHLIYPKRKRRSRQNKGHDGRIQKNPPKEISGIRVSQKEDYLKSERVFPFENRTEKIDLPVADVLIFILEDHSKIAIRPSGTEPKIKFYFSVNEKLEQNEEWDVMESQLDQKIETIVKGIGL